MSINKIKEEISNFFSRKCPYQKRCPFYRKGSIVCEGHDNLNYCGKYRGFNQLKKKGNHGR